MAPILFAGGPEVFCDHCGTSQPNANRFCDHCGADLSRAPDGTDLEARADFAPSLREADSSHVGPPTEELGPVTSEKPPRKRWSWYRRPAVIVPLTMLVVAALVGASFGIFHLGQSSGTERKVSAGAPSSRPPSSASSTTTSSPTAPNSFAQVFAQDSSGVVRLDATSCGGSDVGTGFLVGSNLVATANHVVDGASVIGVTAGTETRVGTVVGADNATDVALIQLNAPLTGHVFGLQGTPPAVGTPVAAIGFPEGLPITLTQGSISGLDRTITLGGQARTGLIQTDASVNPGNSGGPLVESAGHVVGIVDAGTTQLNGIGFAVSGTNAKPLLASWQANPQTVASQTKLWKPHWSARRRKSAFRSHWHAAAMGQTLLTYFRAIDSADYTTAWSQLTAERRQSTTVDQFAAGLRTTYDFNVVLHSLTPQSPGCGDCVRHLHESPEPANGSPWRVL